MQRGKRRKGREREEEERRRRGRVLCSWEKRGKGRKREKGRLGSSGSHRPVTRHRAISRPPLHEKRPCSNRLWKVQKMLKATDAHHCAETSKNATKKHHHCPRLHENATNHCKNDKLMSKIRKTSHRTWQKTKNWCPKLTNRGVLIRRKVWASKNLGFHLIGPCRFFLGKNDSKKSGGS